MAPQGDGGRAALARAHWHLALTLSAASQSFHQGCLPLEEEGYHRGYLEGRGHYSLHLYLPQGGYHLLLREVTAQGALAQMEVGGRLGPTQAYGREEVYVLADAFREVGEAVLALALARRAGTDQPGIALARRRLSQAHRRLKAVLREAS